MALPRTGRNLGPLILLVNFERALTLPGQWVSKSMVRVPSIDPKRDKDVARLQRLLAELDSIPEERRGRACRRAIADGAAAIKGTWSVDRR